MIEAASQLWGEEFNYDTRSWTDCFDPEELCGGPSPWGNSKWSAFEKCPHYYDVLYNLRWKPVAADKNLEIGGLFHEARARYYNADLERGNNDEHCLHEMFDVIDRCQDHVPHFAAPVRRLLEGWLKAHGPETSTDDRAETLLVEPLIEINKVFPYSTRLDRVILSHEAGGPVIMEIKTTSQRSRRLLQSYTVDPQFLGQQYCWRESAWIEEYGPLTAFIVDLAVKGNEQQFPRIAVTVDDDAIDDWWRAKCESWIQMQRCIHHDYWPRNRANCLQWGVMCKLHEHCAILGRGNDPYPGWRKKKQTEY